MLPPPPPPLPPLQCPQLNHDRKLETLSSKVKTSPVTGFPAQSHTSGIDVCRAI